MGIGGCAQSPIPISIHFFMNYLVYIKYKNFNILYFKKNEFHSQSKL